MTENSMHVLICGLGESGRAAAELLAGEGASIMAIDAGDSAALRERSRALTKLRVMTMLGVGDKLPAGDFDLCVVSPGVPETAPWIVQARERGIPVKPELEVGCERLRGVPLLAVTGSNGKSTAVKLLGGTCEAAGLKTEIGGNYGVPVSRIAALPEKPQALVLEVSTFQLETATAFSPDVAVLLNIHPNHLDRHGDMARYKALKARLFARAGEETVCVVPEGLRAEVQELAGDGGQWLTFGEGAAADYEYRDGQVVRDGEVIGDLRGTHFENPVLGLAGAAVMAAAVGAGIPAGYVVEAARDFEPLPHRMQAVAEVEGVQYINDSKATNLSALAAALRMLPGGVRLIAGGQLKEGDLSFVKELLAKKVLGVYLIGQASNDMFSAWSGTVPCEACETLEQAVARASTAAQPGEIVLLSPACASFDQFRSFEERGGTFMRLVRDLAGEGVQ